MQIEAKRENFLGALYWAQSIVERRNTMPILANVLIESSKGDIRVTATDLEIGIRGRLDGIVSYEGMVSVNARKLYEIVREAPEEIIQMKRLENEWVEIKSGRSFFKIVGMDAREFPQFPNFKGEKLFSVRTSVLGEMIEKTIFSVSADETRRSLNGVFIEQGEGDNVRMIATDGHRLAFIERKIGSIGLEKGVNLPRKGLVELKKLLEEGEEEEVSIGFKENMVLVVKGNIELFMRLVDGDFPDYDKVIPRGNPHIVRIKQDSFLQALRRVSILSSERYKGIKVEVKEGQMLISANNPDLGEAVEEITIDYHGKELTIGFNARYIIDVLGVLTGGGDIDIELKDELSPSLIKKQGDEGYLYILMPMRL